jgi:hypothetical protein
MDTSLPAAKFNGPGKHYVISVGHVPYSPARVAVSYYFSSAVDSAIFGDLLAA